MGLRFRDVRAWKRLLGVSACAAMLLIGCTKSRTEVIVITGTDLSVPGELDEIRLEVTGPSGELQTATALLRDSPPPRYLGLVYDGGELGPFTVRARGFRASAPVVERVAVFSFQEGRTLVLEMDLLSSCAGLDCGGDQTCAEEGCRAQRIAPEELEELNGQLPDGGSPGEDGGPPSTDGGPLDGGGASDAGPDCTPVPEACDGADNDCDGMTDEDFDLQTDVTNCGSCGTDCGGETCTAGVCDGCAAGTLDCDGNPGNGCEVDGNTDRDDCGTCGTRCRGREDMCCAGTCAETCS